MQKKQNANMSDPFGGEISVLAGAKCQPAQTDGVKSWAERPTLVGSDEGWEANAKHPPIVLCESVDVDVNIKGGLLPRWEAKVVSGLFALQVL